MLWSFALCRLVHIYRIFEALPCFHIQLWAEYVIRMWKVRNLYKVQPEILKQVYQVGRYSPI